MTDKEKFELKVRSVSIDALGYSVLDAKGVKVQNLTPKVNTPFYLMPLLQFLLFVLDELFDQNGKLRIKLVKWPKVIKQLLIFISQIIF